MLFLYSAFGLTFESELELPQLASADPGTSIDVKITIGKVPAQGLDNPDVSNSKFQGSRQGIIWFRVPDIARFQISSGNLIEYQPRPGADEQTIRLYILGSCIGAILHQRRKIVIHGNAIRFGNSCAIFAGQSGNGKSTLAAGFHQLGHEILTDDVCAISDDGKVIPSYPQIKIWEDTARHLRLDTSQMRRIRFQVNKYAYRLSQGFCETSLPVTALYILRTWERNSFAIEPAHGTGKFLLLEQNTYRAGYLRGLGLLDRHLKNCSELANRLHVSRISRPARGYRLKELMDIITDDIQKSDQAA